VQVPVADAARIVLAQKVGTLRLILKNSDDRDVDIPQKLTEENLFAGSGGKSAPMVEMISGGGSGTPTLIPGSPATTPEAPSASQAPGAAITLSSNDVPAENRQRGAYDQANAIARQLQKLDTHATSGQN
jgi:pilus assembly protein CpaB